MNFFLSIILCFALAFGGTGSLPAEPETATTWTIRNFTLIDGEDSYTLDPQARITAAMGSEKMNLHFELESDGKTLLPLSAEITPEELRFAMANGGRGYSLSAEELESMMDLDPESAQILEIVSDLFVNYGALIGAVSGDEELSLAYNEAVMAAVLETCSSETEPVEIELNGETLEAQKMELNMDLNSCFALLDALRTCGVEPLEEMVEDLLKLISLTEETAYADYAEVLEAITEEFEEEPDFSLPMTITVAEAEDLSYALVECSVSVEDEMSMQMREEVVTIGEETGITMDMTVDSYEMKADYTISGTMTGPVTDPDSMHVDYNIIMDNTKYLNSWDEVSSIREDGESIEIPSETEVDMVFDMTKKDGLSDVRFELSFETNSEYEDSTGNFLLTSIQRAEDDGSVTADVAFTVTSEDVEAGVSFELNCAEGAASNYFDGLEIYEITDEAMNGTTEEPSLVMTALVADSSLLNMDVIQLANDPSIQALMNMGVENEDIVYDDEEIDEDIGYDADEDYSYDEGDYEVRTVDTLEEAAAIFGGEIPVYTAPEGYEIHEIDVSPTYLSIIYTSDSDYLNLAVYGYDRDSHFYSKIGDGLTGIDGSVVQLYGDDQESITSATVYPQDGGNSVNFYFGNYVTPDEAAVILAGLE